MTHPHFFSPFLRPAARRLQRSAGKGQQRQHGVRVRPQLEVLESRLVPTTFTLPIVNQTGLDLSQYTIYVAGWSTGGDIGGTYYPPMELALANGSSTAQFTSYSGLPTSGDIPLYNINGLSSITLDSTNPVAGGRVYFFVEPNGTPPPSIAYSNSGQSVTQPTNNNYVFDIVEITQPPDTVNTGLPTVDVQTVDGFVFPLTLTLNNNSQEQVGQPLTNVDVNRASILAAYTSFMNSLGAAGQPYLDLLATSTIAGQASEIVNPGAYLTDGANSGSALNTVWNSALTTLFEMPARTLSMIGDDGDYYKGTPTQLGSNGPWVIHFVGYTDAAEVSPNGNVFNVYSPLTPDPNGSYQTNETAGEMVFANDGVFADQSTTVLDGTSSTYAYVALGLERDIVAALNRGVALLGPTDGLNGDDSTYWGTESNWYPAGQTENLFSLFMHTATVNGTPIFTQPSPAATDFQDTPMGSAYGFGFDENPGAYLPKQPLVPSKFDPVPAGTNTITVTLGPWFQPTPTPSPTPSPPAPLSAATPQQLLAVRWEALCVAAGASNNDASLVELGLVGYFLETRGQPADVQAQLHATFVHDVITDFVLLNVAN